MKPSIVIKAKKEKYIKDEKLKEEDAWVKAILWYLNEQYFKKPNNDNETYDV